MTLKFAIWSACERFGVKPWEFDDMPRVRQVEMLAYDNAKSWLENWRTQRMMGGKRG